MNSFLSAIVICSKANLMDDKTPIETTVTVSSNPEDDIDKVLKSDDDEVWRPDDSDKTPQITVTVTEEEEPITDIIVNGEFEEFVVTVLDKDDIPVVEEEVSVISLIVKRHLNVLLHRHSMYKYSQHEHLARSSK